MPDKYLTKAGQEAQNKKTRDTVARELKAHKKGVAKKARETRPEHRR